MALRLEDKAAWIGDRLSYILNPGCIHPCPMCVCVCGRMLVQSVYKYVFRCLQRPEEGIAYPGTGIAYPGHGLYDVDSGNQILVFGKSSKLS